MRLTQLTLATASSVLVLATLAACGSEPAAPAESADAPVAVEREGGPGASGRIADIDGKTVQVQDEMNGQVAVTWTARTEFTAEVGATLDDVAVGSCVAVMEDQVRITEPMDGECGRPGGPPEGVRVGGTVGEVTAVSEGGFTVGDEQVTVSADTTYVRMEEADASALEVGRCVAAFGEADDTGAVTAAQISVTDGVDGQCGMVMRVDREGER